MKNKKSVIPNFFTTLNIFCGFLAVISILDGKIVTACWLIILAGVLDIFDGQIARLTKSSSDFGIEFDSLADIVSFGLAPSILLYKVYFYSMGILGIIISFLPLMFGGIRLARFNIVFGGKEKTSFVGLPIPNAAICFTSFIIFNYYFWNELYLSRLMIPQLLLMCVLMLSKVEYYVLPKISFRHGIKNSIEIIIIIVCLIILAIYPQETFYPIVVAYIFWGIVRSIYKTISRGIDSEKQAEIIQK